MSGHPWAGPKRPPTPLVEDLDVNPITLKVREILDSVLAVDAEALTLDAALVENLGADSLDVVEIAMDIEEQLGVAVDDDIEGLVLVSDVVAYVRKRARARS